MRKFSKPISFRLSNAEDAVFQELARKAGKKPSSLARELIRRHISETISV